MPTTTITSKGQVTIPKKIREKLDLQTGDVLNFKFETENTIIVRPKKESKEKAFGLLSKSTQESLSVEEMESGVAEYFRKNYKAQLSADLPALHF